MTLTKIKLIAAVSELALAVSTAAAAFYVASNVSAPKPLVTAPAPAPQSAPAVADATPTSDPDYYTTYALKPDQYIAVLPHVDPAIRDSLVADLSPGRGAANKPAHAPATMVIQWQNEQPTLWGYNSTPPAFPSTIIFAGPSSTSSLPLNSAAPTSKPSPSKPNHPRRRRLPAPGMPQATRRRPPDHRRRTLQTPHHRLHPGTNSWTASSSPAPTRFHPPL